MGRLRGLSPTATTFNGNSRSLPLLLIVATYCVACTAVSGVLSLLNSGCVDIVASTAVSSEHDDQRTISIYLHRDERWRFPSLTRLFKETSRSKGRCFLLVETKSAVGLELDPKLHPIHVPMTSTPSPRSPRKSTFLSWLGDKKHSMHQALEMERPGT